MILFEMGILRLSSFGLRCGHECQHPSRHCSPRVLYLMNSRIQQRGWARSASPRGCRRRVMESWLVFQVQVCAWLISKPGEKVKKHADKTFYSSEQKRQPKRCKMTICVHAAKGTRALVTLLHTTLPLPFPLARCWQTSEAAISFINATYSSRGRERMTGQEAPEFP